MKDPHIKDPTAAIIIIGNEILSGRTRDANIQFLGTRLCELGVELSEVRIIPDIEQTIIDTVLELSGKYTHVFTTGGIGPTHDDITSESIGNAFGCTMHFHPEAMECLKQRYNNELTEGRKKMAWIPEGADLIKNPVSQAPGFVLNNVFVFAGVPEIMQAMFDQIVPQIATGDPIISETISCPKLPESAIAEGLGKIQHACPEVDIGSYPFWNLKGEFGVSVVIKGRDKTYICKAVDMVLELVHQLGAVPIQQPAAAC
ncbi:MAG: competence/damage-inducible protein A [Alphaproteobacteria bacterium]